MAPPREMSMAACALAGTVLWEGVEEDVEKKRHVKDPFRDAFVALVATPFDAVCGKETARRRRTAGDGDEDAMSLDGDNATKVAHTREDDEDCLVLQQDISARSQQVHVRLEILRRQVQCLVAESGAVLDVTGEMLVKREPSTRRNAAAAPNETTQEDAGETNAITDLETLLERAALYESGELTAVDLQKSWQNCKCGKRTHKVTGADERLQLLRNAVEADYQAYRERQLAHFGPKIPFQHEETYGSGTKSSDDSNGEEMARFLEDCKRSIKPFFLEDFIQLDQEISQEVETSPDTPLSESDKRVTPSADPPSPPVEDEGITMSDIDSASDNESIEPRQYRVASADSTTARDVNPPAQPPLVSRAALSLSVDRLRERREQLRAEALRLDDERERSRKLEPRASRVSECSKASGRLQVARKTSSLLSDFKAWGIFAKSIINPCTDLLELRESLERRDNIFVGDSITTSQQASGAVRIEAPESKTAPVGSCSNSGPATGGGASSSNQELSSQSKRQSGDHEAPRSKKQRIDNKVQPARSQTLHAMIQSIQQAFVRIAQTSCVSYLSTLIRSSVMCASPQRMFVALVFSASLANSVADPHDEPMDKRRCLRVELQPSHGARDVKLICKHKES